jgi:hypothetical protein
MIEIGPGNMVKMEAEPPAAYLRERGGELQCLPLELIRTARQMIPATTFACHSLRSDL